MGKKKSIGLPGGPNEFLQDITQYISVEGYKRTSPDINNPVNIIESSSITMEDVDFPVMGIDNLGNKQMMLPESNYSFPGDMVMEMRMAKDGGDLYKAQRGFFDSMKSYLKGEQGYIPDYFTGDVPTKKALSNIKDAVLENPEIITKVLKYTPPGMAVKGIDDALQVLSIPGALVAEGVEGIGNEGDEEFNFMDAMPTLSDAIYDPTTMKTVSGVTDVDGVPGFLLDVATDPTSYVGVGIAKSLVKKGATKTVPQIIKGADEVIDIFGNKISKSDAIRLNRIEDANVTNAVFNKADGTLPYETGNWFSSNIEPFYLNKTKVAGNPNELLDMDANRRLLTTFLSPDDAKKFNILNLDPTTSASQMSGGVGNLPISSEYVIPPSLVRSLRESGSIGNPQATMENLINFYKKFGGNLPKAQFGWVDDMVKAGAKKLDDIFAKAPKLNVTGLDDAVYKTGYKQYDNLTMSQLDDVVSSRKAWINSDEYLTRRFNQLRKTDKYKYLPKDDLRNLIKDNVKSMENAFDDLTVKFSKDFDMNGVYLGDKIGIKVPDGSGVGYSPTLNTYLDVFDHEVMHALQPKSGSWNEKYLESIYKIAKGKIDEGIDVSKIKNMLLKKGTTMDEISKGFHKGQNHMTTNLNPALKEVPSGSFENQFKYLSNPAEQNVRHIQAIENLVKKYGYNYGKVSDDLLKKFADDVIKGNNKFGVDNLFRNLADDSGKAVDVGSKGWNDLVKPILENAWMFPVASTVAGVTEFKKGGSVSWQWKGKTYSGTLIPSMETAKARYARTKNGKIKTLPKKETGGESQVYQIWENTTGTPWAEAKSKGLTDGSYDSNLELREDLLSNPDKFKVDSKDLPGANTNNATIGTFSEVEINDKINASDDFNSAFKIARQYYGPNKIFNYQGSQFGTNLKGEEFKPSNADMEAAGLKVPQKEDIELQNELVVSPYSTTDIVEIDEYEDIDSIKQRTNDLNKMSQADLIVNFQNQSGNNKPYVIVDKKAGLMHVYEPGDDPNKPIYSAPVDLGAVMGDAQTVTKYVDINQDGIISQDEISPDNIDWSAGNKMTGAGRYKISNINRAGYMNLPSFNLSNEIGQNVGTSFHAGYIDDDNSRVSNGCIRCNQGTLSVLTDYLQNSSEVFILPEDEGNKFVFENGQLNFKAGSKRDDYLEYEDQEGNIQKGQGINRTVNTLNYQPIQIDINEERFKKDQSDLNEEYTNTVVPFVQSLQDNKQKVMKALKVNGDVYNDLAEVAFGIFGNETGFGETHSVLGNTLRGAAKIGSSLFDEAIEGLNLPDSLKIGPRGSVDYKLERGINEQLADLGLVDPDDSSMGLTQVRWNQIEKEPALVEALSSVGITQGKDFDDPTKAALGTVAILAYLRNNRQGGNVPIEDLPRLYAGTSSTDPDRIAYTRNVFNNADYLNIKQKKMQMAGETNNSLITNDILLRQAFAESSFDPNAVSPANARGLAQFRPITEKELLRLGFVDETFDPLDPIQASKAQNDYMNYLLDRPYIKKGDDKVQLAKALFAYNKGPEGALKKLNKLKAEGINIYDNLDWIENINKESREYIKKIFGDFDDFNTEYENTIIKPKYKSIIDLYKKDGGDIRSLKHLYKNYINGTYNNSLSLKVGEKAYDKLNRRYYRSAKQAGMTAPNYIMTYIVGNS